jgi:alpha-L-fucosidase
MHTTRLCHGLAAASLLLGTVISSPAAPAGETPQQRDARLQWFREARFGMFIHWGVYAVPAGTWQGRQIGGIGEWILRNAEIQVKDYKALAGQFTAANYNPKAWADLAKEAGMKYVVITSKHHDGFALYDSAVSDWNAVKASPAARDLLAPLAKATRANGLKFGLYYSQAQDWIHPGGAIMSKAPWDEAQKGDFAQYIHKIAVPQTKEILERYKPDILWWDTPVSMTAELAKPLNDLLPLVPGIVTNDRLGGGYPGDTRTPEQHIPPRGYPGQMFEVCMTMNDTWGYKSYDHNWKSVSQILHNLSDIASKGGNFLLNVGPTAAGVIPQESIDRLKTVGKWMKTNGEAIYATEASPFARRLPWGRVTRKTSGNKTTLYLHVWDWPSDGTLMLPTLKETPVAGRVLANGMPVTAEANSDGVVVKVPGAATDPIISVVVLEFDGPLTITQQPFIAPAADGRIHLDAHAADVHGDVGGTIKVEGLGKEAYLSKWNAPHWSIEYVISTPAARKWNLKAEVAAPKAVGLSVKAGKAESTVAVPATGDGTDFKSVPLGTVELPAGQSSLILRGVAKDWTPVQIREVTLEPAP